MHELRQLKKRILCFVALGAWLGLATGVSQAREEIIAQQWIDIGLWRLVLWHSQKVLTQTWKDAFTLLVPIFLFQTLFPIVLRRRPTLASILIFFATALCLYWNKPSLWTSAGSTLLALGISFFVATYWIDRIRFIPKITWLANCPRLKRYVTLFGVGLFFAPVLLPPLLQILNLVDRRINQPTGPNVLFIVVDSLRADHIETYGYGQSTMPSIDQLAKDATVFQNAISVAPWTTPAISSMLSSRYPRGRVWPSVPYPLAKNMTLLSEIFHNANYQTAAFVSHYYIGKRIGFSQGFQQYDDREARGHRHTSAPAVTQKAVHFLEQNREKPFFLFVHYFDPHYDYFAHEPYIFSQGYTGKLKSGPDYLQLKAGASALSPEDLQFVRALYDSEIRFTDAQIHRLLEYLKVQNLYDNTLIVFAADHGEDFCDRADCYIGHSVHLYRALTHVPFLVKLPNHSSQISIEQPVSMIDVAPTIAHYAKLPNPKASPFEGQALLWDEKQVIQASPIFSEARGQVTWVSWPWKLLVDTERSSWELYDIKIDPHETQNRVNDFPNVFSQLSKELTQFMHDHPVDDKIKTYEPVSFSLEEIEQLKAMGYIE